MANIRRSRLVTSRKGIRIGLLLLLGNWLPMASSVLALQVPSRPGATAPPGASAEPQSDNRVQLEGRVIDQQKYRFTVLVGDQQHVVRLGPEAVVGLRMHKPWFDWKAGKVYVNPRPEHPMDESEEATDSPDLAGDESASDRIPVKIPLGPLFLISRFRNASQMQRIMAATEKRINFYLISPDNPGDHAPTDAEPYISGQLVHAPDQPLLLRIGTRDYRIRLGFQTATLNGFTIADLTAEKTYVTLTGERDPKTGDVSATSIVFEPLSR